MVELWFWWNLMQKDIYKPPGMTIPKISQVFRVWCPHHPHPRLPHKSAPALPSSTDPPERLPWVKKPRQYHGLRHGGHVFSCKLQTHPAPSSFGLLILVVVPVMTYYFRPCQTHKVGRLSSTSMSCLSRFCHILFVISWCYFTMNSCSPSLECVDWGKRPVSWLTRPPDLVR